MVAACSSSESESAKGSGGTGGVGGGGTAGLDSGTWPDGGGSGGAAATAGEGGGGGTTAAGDCIAITEWKSSAPVVDDSHVAHPLPAFAHNGYFYVHTKKHKENADRVLYSAKIRADGSLEPWVVAWADHGGGPHGFDAIVAGSDPFHFRNGHIARYRFAEGKLTGGDVELLESSTSAAFGGGKYVWDVAVEVAVGSGWLFHLGGFSFDPYAYRPKLYRSAVPLGSAFESVGVDHPAPRPGRSASFTPPSGTNAILYLSENGSRKIWRTTVSAAGEIGGFSAEAELPHRRRQRARRLVRRGSHIDRHSREQGVLGHIGNRRQGGPLDRPGQSA